MFLERIKMEYVIDKHVDCIGLFCPMPLIKTRKALKELGLGGILELTATDNNVVRDVAIWTKQAGASNIAV